MRLRALCQPPSRILFPGSHFSSYFVHFIAEFGRCSSSLPFVMIQPILQFIASKLDSPFIPWKRLVVGFSLFQFSFENWLLWRQFGVYSGKIRPKTIEKEVDQQTFDKSQVCFSPDLINQSHLLRYFAGIRSRKGKI